MKVRVKEKTSKTSSQKAKKAQSSKDKTLKKLKVVTARIADERKGKAEDEDYANLQYTWNKDILDRSYDYFPRVSNTAIGIGSFMGALELALADEFDQIICVDHKSYLPRWRPENIQFYKADIDTAKWKLPTPEKRFDVCYFIETIEHLIWSPLPLLKWMKENTHLAVISTPDDIEWPAMENKPWVHYGHFSNIPAASPGVKGNPKPMFHTKQYNQVEFMELMDYVGFRVLEFFRTGDGKHQMVIIAQPR